MEASGDHHLSNLSKERIMDFDLLNPAERLIAEQAVLGFREVDRARQAAPHGRGLEFIEQATLTQGRGQMARVMEQVLAAASEAEQKGGARVVAGGGRPTATRGR
jgi:hypothetical protein